jgi:hypothetical protein
MDAVGVRRRRLRDDASGGVRESPEPPTAIYRYLQRIRHNMLALSWVARLCLVVWVLAGLYGLYQFVGDAAAATRTLSVDEQTRRSTTWAPIYGFGQACASQLLPQARLVLVDPTGLTSSASAASSGYGQAPDIDVFNASAFVYTVYPREVTLLGHAPTQQELQALAPDYWAVWRQAVFRPDNAQSEASSAEISLAALTGEQKVCAYTDAHGNTGDIFAASPRARTAFASAGQVPLLASPQRIETSVTAPFESWGAYWRALLGLASLWIIGIIALRLLLAGAVGWRVIVTLALPTGGLLAALELLVFSLLQIPWSAPLLALPWFLLGALEIFNYLRGPGRSNLPRWNVGMLSRLWPRLALDEYIALAVLAVITLVVIGVSTIELPYSDGFQIYYFKALAYFADQNATSFYAMAKNLSYTIPAHPPLIPLDITWLSLFIGRVDEHSSLLLWPALWISLLAICFLFARALSSRRIAIWLTLSLALFGLVTSGATRGGFTDMPLAVYIVAFCFVLLLWAQSRSQSLRLAITAGLFLGAMALTKEEGFIAALVALVVLLAIIAAQWRLNRWSWQEVAPRFRSVGVIAAVGVLTILPWLVLRWRYPLPELLVSLGDMGVVALVERLIMAAVGLALRALVFWAPAILLAMLWIVTRARSTFTWRGAVSLLILPFMGALILLMLMADVAGMAVNASAIGDEIMHTATRLLMQLTPLVFVISALFWAGLLRQERTPVAAKAPSQNV